MISCGCMLNDVSRLVGVNSNVYMHIALDCCAFLFTRDWSWNGICSTSICRLCRTEASVNHTAALFAVKQELATRISDLLNVAVAANNALPQHIWDRCMQRVKTLERATEDLVDFHSQVSKNYKILTITSGPRSVPRTPLSLQTQSKPDLFQKAAFTKTTGFWMQKASWCNMH